LPFQRKVKAPKSQTESIHRDINTTPTNTEIIAAPRNEADELLLDPDHANKTLS
jgi:hypothetical protein